MHRHSSICIQYLHIWFWKIRYAQINAMKQMQSKIYVAAHACALLMKRNESADDVKEKGADLAK